MNMNNSVLALFLDVFFFMFKFHLSYNFNKFVHLNCASIFGDREFWVVIEKSYHVPYTVYAMHCNIAI